MSTALVVPTPALPDVSAQPPRTIVSITPRVVLPREGRAAPHQRNEVIHYSDGTTEIILLPKDGSRIPCVIDTKDYPLVKDYCWSPTKYGNAFYAQANVRRANGKHSTILMHRLLIPNAPQVDHKSRNTLDNRRSNLRRATNAQNQRNRGKHANKTSSNFKGVFFDKRRNKYCAQIQHDGKGLHLGYFTNEVDAAFAYNTAAKELHGEFAHLNVIPVAEKAAA